VVELEHRHAAARILREEVRTQLLARAQVDLHGRDVEALLGDEQPDFAGARRALVVVVFHGLARVVISQCTRRAPRRDRAAVSGSNAVRIIRAMANLVTLSRLLLLMIVVWIFYLPPTRWQLLSFALIILIFVS